MSCASMAQKCPTDQDRATDYLLGAPWWASLLMSGFMASSRGQPFPSPRCPSLLWGSQLCEKLPLLKAWRQRPGGLLLSLSWKIVQCQKAQPKQTFLKRWRGLVGNGGRCLRQTKTNTNSDANKSSQNKGMLWRFMACRSGVLLIWSVPGRPSHPSRPSHAPWTATVLSRKVMLPGNLAMSRCRADRRHWAKVLMAMWYEVWRRMAVPVRSRFSSAAGHCSLWSKRF